MDSPLFLFAILIIPFSNTASALDSIGEKLHTTPSVDPNGGVAISFTQPGYENTLIADALDEAKYQVLFMAYLFTAKKVGAALLRAKKRGVDVRVILGQRNINAQHSGAAYLANHQIPVYVDKQLTIMHNKIATIDTRTVIVGDIVLYNVSQLSSQYAKYWINHARHSNLYANPAPATK